MTNASEKPAKEIFEIMKKTKCREIIFHYDPKTNLQLILVIDSIPEKRDKSGKLNISVSGGTRFAHNAPDEALQDALKLAKAMTRKAKVLNVKEGGGKAVVLANQKKNKKLLLAIGDFIQLHKGLFKTAIDLGFVLKEGDIIASRSDFIDSLSYLKKSLGSTGKNTAEGMIYGYKVICKEILKKPLSKCRVAIQGLGAVGMALAKRLRERNVEVFGSDLNKERCKLAKKIGVKILPVDEILFKEVDILAPCAFGGVINKKIIPKLKCKVIAGGANNPLEDELKDERALLKRGIVYIPDFVLNCSGFLQALVEREGGTINEARKRAKIVEKRIKEIIKFSRENNCTLLEAAIKLFD